MIRPCDMMVVAMSRLIGDGDTVFHGVSSHMPMIATLLAKKTHAPNAVHLNIPGGVDPVKPALREYTSAGGELWESACAMEDLSDHALMRYALMRHETFPRFAEDISTYMVNTLLKTTDVALSLIHISEPTRH